MTRRSFAAALALSLAACGGQRDDAGEPPSVALGVMNGGPWRALEGEASLPVVLGPQGGWMVFLSVRGSAIDPHAVTTLTIVPNDGPTTPLGTATVRGGFTTDERGASVLEDEWVPFDTAWWAHPEFLVHRPVVASATVTNPDGQSGTASVATILGELRR